MAYCRNCGHQVEADAKFCPECGQDQGRVEKPELPNSPFPDAVDLSEPWHTVETKEDHLDSDDSDFKPDDR